MIHPSFAVFSSFLQTMKFLLKVSAVLTLASSAMAGQCSNHNKGAHRVDCVSKSEISQHGEDFCATHWEDISGTWSNFADSSGHTANIGMIGSFSSNAACKSAFADIVDSCYNGWDGGGWVAYGTLLHINFCKWGSDDKEEL
ncbi:hypothetical protein MKX08_004231 [Trichoderma sp. CBMAI-0020]|nr:hypothetical protein MKX08_004231 [Trichoderma sp. CBMAI-0020]WOD45931.1 hypothetical protein [Trichoderma atroviride]